MSLKKHGVKTYFFPRLFIFNVVIVVLVTFIPVIIYYQYFSISFNEQLENINLQTVKQFRNTIDEQYLKDSVKLVQNNFVDSLQDDSLIKPMEDSIRNDSKSILNVINQLNSIQSNMPNVDSIDVYYKNDNVIFYNSRLCFMSEQSCTIGSRIDWVEGFRNSDEQVKWLPPRIIDSEKSESVITYVRSIPYFAPPEKRKATIAIHISDAKLRKSLTALRNPSDGLILIMDEQGNMIANNQTNLGLDHLKKYQGAWIEKVISAEKGGMFNDELDGNSTMITFEKSEINNWRYVSLVNKDLFYKKTYELRNWLMSFVIIFLLISILISYILTRKAHKPIRSVIGDYSSQIVNLNQMVEINKPVIRHNYIMGLLHNDLISNHNVLGSDMGMESNRWKRLISFVIQTPNMEAFDKEQASSYHLIGLLESSGNEGYKVWAIKDYGKQINGIVFLNETTFETEVISKIVHSIEMIYDRGYMLSHGETYELVDEAISTSFQQANLALEYKYLYPHNRILSYSDLSIQLRHSSSNSLDILSEIEASIRMCDEKKAKDLITELENEMTRGLYTVDYCKFLLSDLLVKIKSAIEFMGLPSVQHFGYDIREKYKEFDNIEKVMAWINGLVERAIESIDERKLSIHHNIEMKIKDYIQAHLYDDISLERVADELNFKSNYLGKLFKKSTGINFTEYLTECRLTEAAKLLKENNLSVQEIANKLGYNSTNHFIRIFKEKFGDTPKKYQLLHK
ncbi:hypothetical protein SY83_01445 [Paenibacillus swuensis]|uniref:HTH araC/xylS-type domain-containing protein n=1 Tax=Paenibacillus swuensis TaxID=1178515 RepID=A0A172TDV3_9BACL|nr:helix-turn-helix domain-containing protein [Paenibacillus swuensis]ANE45215.1 hypothetical protein SY83_01445 [Paenibacillus swuensis]